MRVRMARLMSVLLGVGLLALACTTPSPTPTEPPEPVPTSVPEATTTPPSPAVKRGGALRLLGAEAFQNLDPAHSQLQTDGQPISMVYEGLVASDPETLEPLPLLAKSWEISDDGLTYTFYLQEGVKWHNGDDFVADDVKYTVERILDPEEGSPITTILSSIESVEVVNDHTVVFHLKEPFAPQLDYLVGTRIQNRKFTEAAGGTTPRTMMGTGPFVFKEWIPDQVLRLERNPNYWRTGEDEQPLPYLDGIEFYFTADDTARVANFVTGQADMMTIVPNAELQNLQQNSDVVLAGPQSIVYAAIWMHTKTPPFDDWRVRQAVCWAINRDEIAKVGLFGNVDPLYGGLIPEWHWASTGFRVYDRRDVEKARALLAEAGYPDGFETTIYTPDRDPYRTIAEMSTGYLRDVGIDATVEIQETGTFFDNFLNERLPIYTLGGGLSGEPDEAYFLNFHTGGATNPLAYSNPEVDRLTEKGRRTANLTERREIYQQVEEIILKEVPQCFVSMQHRYEVHYSYVKGYVHMPNLDFSTLAAVWLDK